MMTRILLPFAATLLVTALPPAQDAVKRELDKLQGDWTMVSREVRGKKTPEEIAKQSRAHDQGQPVDEDIPSKCRNGDVQD